MTSIFEGQPPKNKAFSKQNKVHLGSREASMKGKGCHQKDPTRHGC